MTQLPTYQQIPQYQPPQVIPPASPPPAVTKSSSVFSKLLTGLFLFLLGISIGGSGTYYYLDIMGGDLSFMGIPEPTPTPLPPMSPTPSPFPDTPTPSPQLEWNEALYAGFSYEYPYGWHVARIGEVTAPSGMRIAISSDPLTSIGGDGPLGEIEMIVINGQLDPDAVLEAQKAQFNDENYTDIEELVIEMDHGQAFYYTGKIAGEFRNGTEVEQYIFSINESQTDPANVQIIVLTTYPTSPEDSERLKHIAESFKDLTPQPTTTENEPQ